MSEWPGYASILEEKFDFVNTYYHQEPLLDITSDSWKKFEGCNFVLCMEVLEHILPPVEIALANLRKMLRSDGTLILSTPFTDRSKTQEHFENLDHFESVKFGNEWIVINKDQNGQFRVFEKDIHFHGGPGSVLEMRLFSQNELLMQLSSAGFDVKVYEDALLDIGYYWPLSEERKEAGVGLHFIISARPR